MANTDLVNEGLLADYHDELMKTHLAGGVVFDISAYNLTNGQPTPYADLAAALGTNGANVPEPLRKGGMSVKFIQGTVQSHDNKYVQYRLMATSWSTNASDWQEVGSEVTTANTVSSDLEMADGNDNILMRLKGGHIKTKNFDSSTIVTSSNVDEKITEAKNELKGDSETDTSESETIAGAKKYTEATGAAAIAHADINKVDKEDITQETGIALDKVMSQKASTENFVNIAIGNSDIDITDESDNIILRIFRGNIITKGFDSSAIKAANISDNAIKAANISDNAITKRKLNKDVLDSFSAVDDDETDNEFSVVDQHGNIIFRIKDGFPDTKHFNNKNAVFSEDSAKTDLELSDSNGNSIFRIVNGYPKTKNFDGDAIEKDLIEAISVKSNMTPLLYKADTSHINDEDYISKAVVLKDGTIIACRRDKVIKIDLDGTENLVFSNEGIVTSFQSLWKDSNDNVYMSPKVSASSESNLEQLGIYRMGYGESTFSYVHALYNPNSTDVKESSPNSGYIWNWCEDDKGNLYAGVYTFVGDTYYVPNPSIYKSVDNGLSWSKIVDFSQSLAVGSIHVHGIVFNNKNKTLYTCAGEVNAFFKSEDYGTTWKNMNIKTPYGKCALLHATPYGFLAASDTAYDCRIFMIRFDGSITEVFKMWANVVYSFVQSDVSGYIYAFTKNDSAVKEAAYYPPAEAIDDVSAIDTWRLTNPSHYAEWEEYYNNNKDVYPDDCIKPQHCAVLVSKDYGFTWEILKRYRITPTSNGFVSASNFINGECLANGINDLDDNLTNNHPIVISEHYKKKYTSNGIDISGDIFIRTNSSNYIN